MNRLFEIATSVSTPLALGGFLAAVVFYIFRQIVAKNIFPKVTAAIGADILKLIIERLSVLALVAMILGFIAYLVVNIIPAPRSSALSPSQPPHSDERRSEISPPLSRCKAGTIGLNERIAENVERSVCLSTAAISTPTAEPETHITGVTNLLKWHVFDSTGARPVAICYCYQ
jgi:hypothetical protein